MLLQIDKKDGLTKRLPGKRLKNFGLDERGLQDILFRNLGYLLADEELLLISQSIRWREEPDLLALDKQGRLYIFEIKAWESNSETLLQVLKYGQIFGPYNYYRLNRLFKRSDRSDQTLAEAHKNAFDTELEPSQFNQKQIFVILTNGTDIKTREAIKYWKSAGLEVQPWIYRVYPNSDRNDSFLLEINRFGPEDYPYEDVASGFYMLNTNYGNSPADHEDMISNGKAAAYFYPWKHKIEKISKGDTVFLYQNKVGIVAMGNANGKLEKAPYHGNPDHANEEYFMALDSFQRVEPAILASQIKTIIKRNPNFRGTLSAIDKDSGELLQKEINKRGSSNL